MKKWRCLGFNSCRLEEKCQAESAFRPTTCLGLLTTVNWEEIKNTNVPTLTKAIFEEKSCPSWGAFAAVDFNGDAFVYGNEPKITGSVWDGTPKMLMGKFCSSGWHKSLIKKEELTVVGGPISVGDCVRVCEGKLVSYGEIGVVACKDQKLSLYLVDFSPYQQGWFIASSLERVRK